MLNIRDNVVIGLTIGDEEYPLEKGGFRDLVITATHDAFVPTMEIRLYDNHQFFTSSVTLADGIPVSIRIGPDQEAFEIYNFRVFKFTQMIEGAAPMYHLRCYLDCPLWFIESRALPIKGSSSVAIETLASEAGMDFETDPTIDDMVWIPKNERRCVFANRICQHGYVDPTSFMRLAVIPSGKRGRVRYLNIAKYNPVSSEIATVVPTDPRVEEGVFQAVDYRAVIRSGFSNVSGGYRYKIVEQDVLKSAAQEITESIQMKKMSERYLIGSRVKQDINQSRVDFRPIDCGNLHDNYDKAWYQNKRMASLYSAGIEFMINNISNMNLLDPIRFRMTQAPGAEQPQENDALSGFYVITAKAIYVSVGNYFEKFQGYSTGINREYGGVRTQE